MKYYNYKEISEKLNELDFTKEMQIIENVQTGLEHHPQLRDELVLESTLASMELEVTPIYPTRAHDLMPLTRDDDAELTRSEMEFVGYKETIKIINDSFEYIPVNTNYIRQFHKEIYEFSKPQMGGGYRSSCLFIGEINEEGVEEQLFESIAAHETKISFENLLENSMMNKDNFENKLAFTAILAFDLYMIQPFNFGNGHIMRILIRLLMKKFGFDIFDYVSLEKLIKEDLSSFNKALKLSAIGYLEDENDYSTFVVYFINLVKKAYENL
ncbi:MAG: hypothetical protein GXY87_01980 [Tissierellia bacterium]|nr:hypothetical protein [Tissierellia bacterium]